MAFELTDGQAEAFHRDGYVMIENFLDEQETAMLLSAAKEDAQLREKAHYVTDTKGNKSTLSLWNHPSNDIFGMVARSRKVVDSTEKLLDDEVYHYHSKVMMKEPKVGGAWEWHQDYGYWYNNGCLYPDMLSVLIALDPATKENGCLQVLKGSHKIGRIEHGQFGTQTGADPERVEAAMDRFELVHCEMKPGTALFFHALTLHASAANTSEKPRWSLICCYNTKHNDPYKESHHPGYTPLEKVDDAMIKQYGAKELDHARAYLEVDEGDSVTERHQRAEAARRGS